MNEEQKQRILRAALSRRGFLTGTAGLALGAALTAAGCGGGGGNGNQTPGERYNGTYRLRDYDRSIFASATIDENGDVTYWALDTEAEYLGTGRFADFGQTSLDGDRFELADQEFDVETLARVDGGSIRGRTQDINDTRAGFDWRATRAGRGSLGRPPEEFVGHFSGRARIDDFDIFVLLGVSPDGSATFPGFFDDTTVPDGSVTEEPFYSFESLRFDDRGTGYDYFIGRFDDTDTNDFEGDRIDLDFENSGVVLIYTVGRGESAGLSFRLPLDRQASVLRSTPAAQSAKIRRGRIPGQAGMSRSRTAFDRLRARRGE